MSPCTPCVVALARRGALPWKFKSTATHPASKGWVSCFRLPRAHRSSGHHPSTGGIQKNQEKIMFTDVVNTTPHIPRINELAPQFEAKSTHGIIKLSDYTSKG